MNKLIWFLVGGAIIGGVVYYFLFANKDQNREQILEKARQAKKEKAESETPAAAING
jgi:prolipoprotein diacylglyceryltransferase